MKRRDYLAGVAGAGALSAVGTASAETDAATRRLRTAAAADGHHPGPPRFVQVGEKLVDPIFTDAGHGFDRDNLAPAVPAPERDPANDAPGDFRWQVASRPDGSTADVVYAPTPYDESATQYDSGRHNVAEFVPDKPGTYVLRLDAPDGTHELTVRAFPEAPSGAGGPPRIALDGHFDSDAGEFVVESNPDLAPNSNAARADLTVEFLPHDASALAASDVTVEDGTARIPKDALDGETELYAAAFDGDAHSTTDEVVLDPAAAAVRLPNRPPDWLDDAVIYEIFTRSFAGRQGATDFDFLTAKADYLADLGVDVVWLTPIVPAWSAQIQAETGKPAPGGPHGYSTGDYFAVADDLGTLADYKRFIQACHDRDIRVCFDFVINHCGWTNPKFQDTIAKTGPDPEHYWEFPAIEAWNTDSKYFDWFDRMASGTDSDAAPAFTSFFGVRLQPNLNYGNLALREHVLAAADFWAKEVGVDAFRCDIAWGVPHSFWKELRERVKAHDSEFMLLDETIPNDPSFAESEFDVHFDTVDFVRTVKEVAAGNAAADELLTAVENRKREGFPNHTRLVNATENHDESRLYVDVEEAGNRENPAKAQRAAAAATFTLPGVPFIYYGQERLISKYGHRRESAFADLPTLSDDVEQNPYSRGFMNWAENGDTVPQDHLAFYKSLVSVYKSSSVLGPEADLRRAWHASDSDDVLAFGRDAGDQQRVVVLNFGDSPATVDLRPGVATTDEFSGQDLAVDGPADRTTVEVDTLAVLQADSLYGAGTEVVALPDDTGDDAGPGGYTYPTADEYAAGEFDLAEFRVHESDDHVQFVVSFDAPLTNPRGYPGGVSHQHLQFYLHDPDAAWGVMQAREGVNARLAGYYQYRVVADGEHGVRVETGERDSDRVATGDLRTTPDGELVVEFPKRVLDRPIASQQIAPLVLGYDPDSPGNVMPVRADAGPHAFGGNGDANAPNVVDTLVPADATQAAALSYGELTARVPYVQLRTPFETVARWDDPTGDGRGPGNYTLPTHGDFYEGCYDVAAVEVQANRDRVRFVYELPTPVKNPWGLPRGFSHQFLQVYVRDPDAPSDRASATEGRHGLHATFEKPYHYRIVVAGERTARVEKPASDAKFGTVASGDVLASVTGNEIRVDVPKHALGGSLDGLQFAPLLAPYDGYGTGGLRAIGPQAKAYVIGGGTDANIEPRVMDLVVPKGTTQKQALAYSESSPATLPYVGLNEPAAGGTGGGDETATTTTTTTTSPQETTTLTDPATTSAETPGFGVLTGLAALGVGAYRALRDDE